MARRAARTIASSSPRTSPTRSATSAATAASCPTAAPPPLDGRTLALADALFTEDALIWDHVRSRSVRYGARHAAPRGRVRRADARHLDQARRAFRLHRAVARRRRSRGLCRRICRRAASSPSRRAGRSGS
ncbi:hypothetical protein AB5I41_20815 [Sphingomonas sp. MMS24-JH45]